MQSAVLRVKARLLAWRTADPYFLAIGTLAGLHSAALALMFWSETGFVEKLAFLLAWGFLFSLCLLATRRPAASAALTLAALCLLVVLSQFKHDILYRTITFIDVMIIDADTVSFLMMIMPSLGWKIAVAAVAATLVLLALWRIDPYRVRRRAALAGCAVLFVALAGLSLAVPLDREDEFGNDSYVSKFFRSGAVAIVDLTTHGLFEADASAAYQLPLADIEECRPARKPPHIIMIFDESSFDASTMPGTKVPPDYQRHFRSFDGKSRSLLVEGSGGPSWFTEYNVLTGLSVRSYGRFAEQVTRIATGRVTRGFPAALRRCGYNTFSMYPWMGAFLGARSFQKTVGFEHFLDAGDLNALQAKPDSFYFDYAARLIAREKSRGPVFVFVYTAANHFPWDYRFHPELAPEWRDLGNYRDIDEYLRRQSMSAKDYAQLRTRLEKEFPGEPFLLIRFGDHQPHFASYFMEPGVADDTIVQHIVKFDPRYFTTYYAIDAVNFAPADLSSALDKLDVPYLPLVVLEAAGLPLPASFAEQKKILQRCDGQFYLCNAGAETRRFNRMLMDAGLIKGM